MEILATMRGNKIVILDGKLRLNAILNTAGYVTVNLDGQPVVVEFDKNKEIVIKEKVINSGLQSSLSIK